MKKKKKIFSRSFVSPTESSNVVCRTVQSGWGTVTWSRAASDKFTVTVAGRGRASSDCDVTLTLHRVSHVTDLRRGPTRFVGQLQLLVVYHAVVPVLLHFGL